METWVGREQETNECGGGDTRPMPGIQSKAVMHVLLVCLSPFWVFDLLAATSSQEVYQLRYRVHTLPCKHRVIAARVSLVQNTSL